jgi:hypothetical protein
MGKKFKDCGNISSNQLKIIGAFIYHSYESGNTDVKSMLIDFYKRANFREPESRALILGNIPPMVDLFASRKSLKERETLSDEDAEKLVELSKQAKNYTRSFSKADNVFDFIKKEIIDPATEGIIEDEEVEDKEEIKEEEKEEEQPDDKDLGKVNDTFYDEEVQTDSKESGVPKMTDAKLFSRAMFYRGGAQMINKDGSTFDVYYETIKGNDFVYSMKNGTKTKPIPLADFIRDNQALSFLPHAPGVNTNGKKQAVREDLFEKTIGWFKRKFAVAYGNAMDKYTAAKSYFSIGEKGLVPGEITQVFKDKNKYFSRLSAIKNPTLKDGFKSGTNVEFFVELSDYPYTKSVKGKDQPYLNIVAHVQNEKTGKIEKMIISNLQPPTDSSAMMLDEKISKDPDVIAYRANYLKLLSQIQASEGSRVSIPSHTKIDKVYVPVLNSASQSNYIYETEKERIDGDLDKAKTLSFKDFKTLVNSMGFGVSRLMVDMNFKSDSKFSSGAFVAVSPFHSAVELNDILNNEREWASGSTLNDIAIRHNINILYLNRKSLKFRDYASALKGNLTGNKRKIKGGTELDQFKVKAMLNPTQSFRILNRIAFALEAMEKKINSMPHAKVVHGIPSELSEREILEASFNKMLFYFFNTANRYSIDLDTKFNAEKISRIAKDLESGKPIPAGEMRQIRQRYDQWKNSSIADKESFIERMAIERYGFFTAGTDEASRMTRENKINFLKSFDKADDQRSDSNYLNEGGMYGRDVVAFFEFASHKAFNGIVDKAFDVESVNGKAIEFPTYNPPAVSKKDILAEGSKISPVGKVFDSRKAEGIDLNEEFLESSAMPMMPHMVVSMDSIMGGANTSYDSGAVDTGGSSASSTTGKRTLRDILHKNRPRNKMFSGEINSADLYLNTLTEQQAKDMTESLLGELAAEMEFYGSVVKMKDGVSLGRVYKGLFQLHSMDGKVSEKVLRHEIFHKVLNEILDPASYERVIAEGYKMIVAEKGEGEYTNEDVDEFLAEFYENSFGTYSNKFVAKLPSWLRSLYQGLRNLYRKLTGNFSELQNILEVLESGGYKTSRAVYNNYDGSVRNKEFKDSEYQLAMKLGFGNNENDILNSGTLKLQEAVYAVRKEVLDKIYQNEELFLETGKVNMGLESAVNKTAAEFKSLLIDFAAESFPDTPITTTEEALAKIKSLTVEQLLDNSSWNDLRDFSRMYEEMDSIREHAFDFFDFSSKVDYEYSIDEDPELKELLDPDSGQDSSLSQMADRGLLSGIKTMNKRVKFHVENTETDDKRQISTSKAHEIMVRMVDDLPRGPKGEFFVASFIEAFRKKVESMESSKGSLEYQTVKALYDKFLNPDIDNSFFALSMKRSDDPALQAFYDRHGDVLNAFVSAYSTVAIQEFVKPMFSRKGSKIRPTNSNRNVELKNEYNSNYLANNFQRISDGKTIRYQLKSNKISDLFGGSGHVSLSVEKKNFVITINGTKLNIPFEKLNEQTNNYTDLDNDFVKSLINEDSGINDSHIIALFRAMGFMVSEAMIPRYLSNTVDKSANGSVREQKERRKKLYWHGIMSYLIMAQQMISEEGINPDASKDLIPGITPQALKKIASVGKNRTDLVKNILREAEQGEAEVEIVGSMFTPTKFSEFFKELGQAGAEFRIGSGSLFEFIANTRHNKDKINTPLKNRVKAASALATRLTQEARLDGQYETVQEYISVNYPNLASSFYFNDLASGAMKVSDYWQLQSVESFENNASKTFLDMTDVEFQRLVLTGLLNGVENPNGSSFDSSVYWHPADIQADRGYLPVFKVDKRYRSNFSSETGISMSPEIAEGLTKNYLHGFNSALSILKQIAATPEGSTIKINGEPLADVIEGANPNTVASVFNDVNSILNDFLDANPNVIKLLAEHAVWQKIDGKFVLNQLILKNVNTSMDDFMAQQERLFERFAAELIENFFQENNPLKNDLDSSKIYESANTSFTKQNVNGQQFSNVSLFKFKEYQEKLEKGEPINMRELTHPAVYDMFMTYRINNLQIRQIMFGELHAFKAQKGIDPASEAAYTVEYSKRLTGAGTSKINPVFYESQTSETGEKYETSRKGLNNKIRVINMETSEYFFSQNPKYLDDIAENRNMSLEEKQRFFNSETFEIDNGAIWSSGLFQSLLRNSMGNNEGFPIDSLMKLILNDVDLKSGHVDYDKALHVTLTPEIMEQVGPIQEMYLKAMYSSGVIQAGEGIQTLWDVYQNKFIETKSRIQAESAVFEAYVSARSEGRILQEPAMYVNNRSTVKGTAKGMNMNPMQALEVQDESSYFGGLVYQDRDLSTGFGGVLDLMGEITDKDIALSSQMLYLLGIVGDKNHRSVGETYKALERLSNINANDIKREVNKIMENKSIKERDEAVRAWALDMIRKNYESQGDFGAGYQMAQDSNSQSVSNPLHKNRMFGAIASKINKGIGIRVKGFKGIQLPATNFLFLYTDPNGNVMTRKEAKANGYSEEQLEAMKRNLTYAQIDHDSKKITQTEILTGNFFAKKFGTGSKSIREVFALTMMNGEPFNVEAADYSAIQEVKDAKGNKVNPHRAALYSKFMADFMNINWKGNSGVSLAIEENKKKAERIRKKIDGLRESEVADDVAERVKLTDEVAKIETRIVVMKNMLKGSNKVEANNAGLVAYEIADAYLKMNKSLYGVMSRIPNTGKNSSTVFRVRAFIDGYKNGVFVPAEWLDITGSDHDGDTAMLWQHGSNDAASETMLESTINILSDYENRSEIFSDIDSSMAFVKRFANEKMKAQIEAGNGYMADDLFTMNKIRANNSVGSTMTGSSALVAKAYAYSYRTKMQFIANGGNPEAFKGPNILIFGENPNTSADLKMGGMIPEKSMSGEYVYKWLETLTNAAIDNAKYLSMGALNLKRLNAAMQASMVMMGFSKQAVSQFFSHEAVERVFRLADSMNDAGGKKYVISALEKAVYQKLTNTKTGTMSVENSLAYVADPLNQAEFSDTYVYHVMNILNGYAKDFKKIQNILKVSDQIKGTPYEQRKQFDKIRIALGFKSISQVKELIDQYKDAQRKGTSVLDMEIMNRGSNNRIIDPKIILLLNPNLMGYLKSHVDFLEKTGSHLLYTEPMIRTRYMFEKLVDRNVASRPFFKNKIDNAFYQQLSTLFLDGFNAAGPVKTTMNNKPFDLSSLEDRMAFIYEFKKQVFDLKNDKRYIENLFVDQLTFDGDIAEIKMSHNFDTAQDAQMLNSFNALDQQTKDNFFYYLLITDGLVFKKHGFMKFISPSTYAKYNEFLKKLEEDPEQIMDEKIINSFVHNFLLSNKDMMKEMTHYFDLSKDAQQEHSINLSIGKSVIDKQSLFEADELEASPSIQNLADKFTTFKPEAKIQLKESNRDMKAAFNAISKFQEDLDKIILSLDKNLASDEDPNTLNDEGKRMVNSILENGVIIPITPNAKWSKKKLEQHAAYSNAVEILKELEDNYKSAQTSYQALYDQLYTERSAEEERNDNAKIKNRSPYRIIKSFDDGNVHYAVFKLRRKGNGKIVWGKVVTYGSLIGLPINAYQTGKEMPILEANEKFSSIDYHTYEKIKAGNISKVPNRASLKNSKTNFFTKIDGNGKMDSYQLTDGFEKAESRQKLKAIAQVLQRAFPGVQIRFVSNQKGMRSKAKGFVNSGVVYINTDLATSDTPLHELGHILIDLIEQQDPELFQKIGRLVMAHPAFAPIAARYEVVGNSETDNIKEAFVTLLGQSQDELIKGLDPNQGPVWDRIKKSFWSTIKNALRKMYESLGIKPEGASEQLISDLNEKSTLNDLFNVVGKAVVEGKVIVDLSSRQFAQLEIKHNGMAKTVFSKAEINRKIKELTELGIITRTCK